MTDQLESLSDLPGLAGADFDELLRNLLRSPYVLQRLSARCWWVEAGEHATLFCVGDESVLLFDPIADSYDAVTAAVASVTDKPVSALLYTHFDAGHLGDSHRYAEAARAAGRPLRIIASDRTTARVGAEGITYAAPTETVAWPRAKCTFEGLTVELQGFGWTADADDHAAWLLASERVVHLPGPAGSRSTAVLALHR